MKKKSNTQKSLMVWIVLFLVIVGLSNIFYQDPMADIGQEMTYTALTEAVAKGDVKSVQMQGQVLTGELKDGKKFKLTNKEDKWLDSEIGIHGIEMKHELQGEMISPVHPPPNCTIASLRHLRLM